MVGRQTLTMTMNPNSKPEILATLAFFPMLGNQTDVSVLAQLVLPFFMIVMLSIF